MNRLAHLQLAFVGMHPDRKRSMLTEHGGPEEVLAAIRSGHCVVPEHARLAARMPVDQRQAQLDKLGATWLAQGDVSYPTHLARLPDAPDILFVRGVVPVEPGVAVVGSRRATRYGLALSRSFGAALGRHGWPVVSGLARGIDAAAHRGTVESAAAGVGVLGCGIDRWYPAEHVELGARLLECGGAVVSEYPPGTPPNGWRFPPRNRIIAGLSSVVVVVEAAVKGGALITARAALEQGVDVFTVPGDLERPTSEGCNLLIRDGAWPIMGVDDLVESVERIMGPAPHLVMESPSDGLAELVGVIGKPVDWIVESTGRSVGDVLTEVSRLEAAGIVTHQNGLVAVRR